MAERNPCLWLQNRIDHTAENDRAVLTGLLGSREGVFGTSDLLVTQRGAGANMSVDVAAGRAAVNGDDSATVQGTYAVWNDATKNLTIAAADPTNPRKDIVIARVRDAFYSGATNAWALEVVTGVPAASPAEPALPNNAIKLAVVTVAALATSIVNANISDTRPFATAVGGIVPCTSATRPTGIREGQFIWEDDTNRVYVYDGAAWQPISVGRRFNSGVSTVATDAGGNVVVAHGLGVVPTAVTVTLTTGSTAATIQQSQPAISTMDASNFVVRVTRADTGGVLASNAITFMWIATT